MSLQQKGEKWEINGEINPQFVKYANEVTILSKQDISDFDASNLQVFFRVISLKELKNILNSDLIQPRSNPDGSQKGEFGITSNSEYCIQNIIYGNTNKNKKGKMPVNNAAKAKYAIMLEIIVEPNTQEKLRDEFGIQAPGQTSHELTDSLPTAEEAGSSNVIEMKVERVPTGGEPIHNVNYMFKSSNPSIEDPSNPLYVFNQSIIEVRIVGGIIPEGEVDFFNL